MSKDTGFSITSAERYSLALFELSEESNLISQIEDQSLSFLNLIEQSEDFSNIIKDPTTSREDLLKAIDIISDNNKFESLFKNFLSFLIQKRRFFFIERILKSFVEICLPLLRLGLTLFAMATRDALLPCGMFKTDTIFSSHIILKIG